MTDIGEQLRDLHDSLLMCGNDYSDVLLNAANAFESTLKQLAECQAREKVLRQAYYLVRNSAAGLTNYCEESANLRRCEKELEQGEALFRGICKDDSTALDDMLKKARREALVEAADYIDTAMFGSTGALYLRRKAEELK
jgi:hypothetical protein